MRDSVVKTLAACLVLAVGAFAFLVVCCVVENVTAQEKTAKEKALEEKALEMIRRDAMEAGPKMIKESFPIGVDHMDTFIDRAKMGRVKYVHVNRMGKQWHLVFGVYGGKRERTMDFSEYAQVRGQILKLLLTQEFNHLTLLYEVEKPKMKAEDIK